MAMKSCREIAQAWNRFWFTPADPTVLGFMRLCGGFVILYVYFAYSFDLHAFFGPDAWLDARAMNELRMQAPFIGPPLDWDEVRVLRPQTPEEDQYVTRWGANPRQTLDQGHHIWSIWYHVTNPFWMRVIHAIVLCSIFCFAIGLGTRVAGVLTWAAVLSYIHRAPTALFGMDSIINLVVLYLVIGPSGAALSMDRLIAWYWARRQARINNLPEPVFPAPLPSVSANVALRLLQVHFCIIYLVAGLSKLQGASWWNGTAVWGPVANYEFSPIRYAAYASALRWLAQHRWSWEVVTTSFTLGTLALEISFPFLVWQPRWRGPMIGASISLHLAIALLMGLVCFSLIMMVMVSSFLPPTAVRRCLAWVGLSEQPAAPTAALLNAAQPVRL
jgi:hypothetical protein